MGSQKSRTQLSMSLQERTPGSFQINRGSETRGLALGHWDYVVWTKRKLKWAASVKHTPLSLTYAEWLMEVHEHPHRRHYHQQKMLFRVWEADLGLYCFLLPVKAFLLMCGFRRGGLHQYLQDMDIWSKTCQRRG